MDIHIIQLTALITSLSYIQTVGINENMLANKVYGRIFTHYQNYRGIFRVIKWIAYGIITYITYLFYKQYGFSIDLIFMILFAYNISLFLRSCLRDLLYIDFYLYLPLILGLLYYFSAQTIVHLPGLLFYLIFIGIFLLQSFIDNYFIKREIEDDFSLRLAINPNIDTSNQRIKDDIMETIITNHPYYSVSQIKYAFGRISKK